MTIELTYPGAGFLPLTSPTSLSLNYVLGATSFTVSGTPAMTFGAIIASAGYMGDGGNSTLRGYATGSVFIQSASGVNYAEFSSTYDKFYSPALLTKYAATTAPNTQTGAAYSIVDTDNYVIANRAGTVTLTLPDPTSVLYIGRTIRVRTIQSQTVVSASGNVVPLAGGAAGTAILAATAGKWADLTADGTAWQITASN